MLRPVQLGKVAAQAEGLRLKRFARRTGTRVALGVLALVFLIFMLVMAHIAAALALEAYVIPVYAFLIVGSIDLVVVIIFGAVAAVSKPGKIEREAYEVRETARKQMVQAMAVGSLAAELLRNVGLRKLIEFAMVMATRRRKRL